MEAETIGQWGHWADIKADIFSVKQSHLGAHGYHLMHGDVGGDNRMPSNAENT